MQVSEVALPVFTSKVRASAKWTDFATWISADETTKLIEKVEEVSPDYEIPENCRLIPVVTRYSRRAQVDDTHHPQAAIKVKVVFYERYFSKLSPVDQAMLVFHEQLYVLASELGHPNADQIRQFLVYLFAEELHEHVASMPEPFLYSQTLLALKNEAIFVFGDYIHFFNDNTAPAEGEPFSQLKVTFPPFMP